MTLAVPTPTPPRHRMQGIKFQMISVDDIAWFVVNALLHPAAWLGRRQEVAGDRLCAEDMAATLARLRGGTEHWKVSVPPDWVFKLFIPKAVGSLKQFLETKGTHVSSTRGRRVDGRRSRHAVSTMACSTLLILAAPCPALFRCARARCRWTSTSAARSTPA